MSSKTDLNISQVWSLKESELNANYALQKVRQVDRSGKVVVTFIQPCATHSGCSISHNKSGKTKLSCLPVLFRLLRNYVQRKIG